MTVINTNIAASVTANAMKTNARAMNNTMERLATGTRVNSASDDAAGLAIGSKMTAQIRGLEQAVRNANDAVSLIQTADGASIEIGDMLQRMRELSVQSRNGTNDTTDISNLNKEFAALATEIDRIADDTEFNGIKVLAGNIDNDYLDFVIGKDQTDTMRVSFTDFNLVAGAASASEVKATANTASDTSAAKIIVDAGGTTFLSDGVTTISVDLTDIRVANSDASLAASGVTAEKMAIALQAKADESTAFKLDITHNSTTGFTYTEKTGKGGTMAAGTGGTTVTYTGVATGLSGTGAITTTVSGGTIGTTGGAMADDLSTYAVASSVSVNLDGVITKLDNAIKGVAQARADFGAVVNTLEHSIDNLNNAIQNTSSAKSSIMDADYAAETTELARTQIISQAATAMLSQANQQQQSVLALLKQHFILLLYEASAPPNGAEVFCSLLGALFQARHGYFILRHTLLTETQIELLGSLQSNQVWP